MPSTQEKKFSFERACSDLSRAGGEPPGEPPALPLRSPEALRPLSQDLVDEALERARLGRSVAGMSDEAREALIDALLDQLRGERGELPEKLRERLLDGMIDGLIAGKRGEREILGQDGVLGEVTRRMVQRALEEELTEHLGYPAGQAPPGGVGNSRNGGTPKTLLTDQGPVGIDTPRDRKSRFEPQLVKKGQRRLAGLDEKIVALYAGGMTTREIAEHVGELYGAEISPDLVSAVTEAVLEEVAAWQSRGLDSTYAIVFFDAIRVKIRNEGLVSNRAVYLAIGVRCSGHKEILGLWIEQTEGAKFWLRVMSELRNRGVQDILIAVVDGLKGFPEAITSVFPKTVVQTCIVHLIRYSMHFASWKERRPIGAALKPIYQAHSAALARERLEDFDRGPWGQKYPAIAQSWRRNWEQVIPFFAFAPELRTMLYTTNAIESLNAQVRKAVRVRGHFPSEEAAAKLIWLVLRNVQARWKNPPITWQAAKTQMAIQFEDRFVLAE